MTIRIRFSELATTDSGDRLPLDALERNGELGHIHGRLAIELQGRVVPWLGFFGPDDVCFDTWLVQLCAAVNALSRGPGVCLFDEGEQGQPAFRFERRGDLLSFSIVAAAYSGGDADPAWQDVTCRFDDFVAAVHRFVKNLRDQLRKTAPHVWERWWPSEAVLVAVTPKGFEEPATYLDRGRDGVWERELPKALALMPEDERFAFLSEVLRLAAEGGRDPRFWLEQARKSISKPHFVEVLRLGLRHGNPRTIRFWLSASAARLGCRRLVAVLEEEALLSPEQIALTLYWLPTLAKTHDEQAIIRAFIDRTGKRV